MTVKELKSMSSSDVKDFIREKLMYSDINFEEFVSDVWRKCKSNNITIGILKDLRNNKNLHKRYDMSGNDDHDDLLCYFDGLYLTSSFWNIDLLFIKGSVFLTYKLNEYDKFKEENLTGCGTVEIIYQVMNIAWNFKED